MVAGRKSPNTSSGHAEQRHCFEAGRLSAGNRGLGKASARHTHARAHAPGRPDARTHACTGLLRFGGVTSKGLGTQQHPIAPSRRHGAISGRSVSSMLCYLHPPTLFLPANTRVQEGKWRKARCAPGRHGTPSQNKLSKGQAPREPPEGGGTAQNNERRSAGTHRTIGSGTGAKSRRRV